MEPRPHGPASGSPGTPYSAGVRDCPRGISPGWAGASAGRADQLADLPPGKQSRKSPLAPPTAPPLHLPPSLRSGGPFWVLIGERPPGLPGSAYQMRGALRRRERSAGRASKGPQEWGGVPGRGAAPGGPLPHRPPELRAQIARVRSVTPH